MKNRIVTLIATFAVSVIFAQNSQDGLRYGLENLNGTARYQAMGGAFTSLGGDLSAMASNPAGSAVFIENTASVSMSVFDNENNTSYFNNTSQLFDTDTSLNQAGGVFLFYPEDEFSRWNKFSFGINYNNTHNYDNEIFIAGVSDTSISNFFLNQAQGISLSLLQLQDNESLSSLYSFLGRNEGVAAQNALLGFQGFIIDPVSNSSTNTSYVSNVQGTSFNQQYAQTTQGYNGKFTFNLGGQYLDDYYFGLNINTHTIDYIENKRINESNSDLNNEISNIYFENNLATRGAGFSAQLGFIAKIKDNVRVGLSLDTPTWYEINEETLQYLETDRTVDGTATAVVVNPNVINIYETYQLRTPGKIAAGISYLFGKQGLISLDYSIKDYSNTRFRYFDTAQPFATVNSDIENNFKAAGIVSLGGEYRYNNMSFRAGARHEESPYENEAILSDLNSISLGFGYNFGNYTLDLGYVRAEQSGINSLYDRGFTNSYSIDTVYSNFIATFGISF